MDRQKREDEIFDSLRRMRERDALFGIDSGRGILGDMMADRQLARDIADGMGVRDALAGQRGMDYLCDDVKSNGVLSDLLEDDAIAADFENGRDLGDAISEQRFWDDLFE